MRHQGSLRRCYDNELQQHDPDLQGAITMTWVIEADGKVSSVGVAGSTMHDANVENCVTAEVKSWTFPTAERPSHVAAYPFKFGTKPQPKHE